MSSLTSNDNKKTNNFKYAKQAKSTILTSSFHDISLMRMFSLLLDERFRTGLKN